MRKPPVLSQNNQGLEQSKSAYRYRIGSGDVLNIMVWAHSDLNSPIQQSNPQTNQVSRGAWVDEGGYITYPLAGKIQAKGKTLDELQNTLTSLLKRYIKKPSSSHQRYPNSVRNVFQYPVPSTKQVNCRSPIFR